MCEVPAYGDRRIYGFSFSGDLLSAIKGKLCLETLVRSGGTSFDIPAF